MSFAVQKLMRSTLIVVDEQRLTRFNSDELGAVLDEVIQAGCKNIILDLSAVEFFASAPIRELISAFKRVNASGGRIILCAPSRRVVDVLDLVGIAGLFPTYPDQVTAIGSC